LNVRTRAEGWDIQTRFAAIDQRLRAPRATMRRVIVTLVRSCVRIASRFGHAELRRLARLAVTLVVMLATRTAFAQPERARSRRDRSLATEAYETTTTRFCKAPDRPLGDARASDVPLAAEPTAAKDCRRHAT